MFPPRHRDNATPTKKKKTKRQRSHTVRSAEKHHQLVQCQLDEQLIENEIAGNPKIVDEGHVGITTTGCGIFPVTSSQRQKIAHR